MRIGWRPKTLRGGTTCLSVAVMLILSGLTATVGEASPQSDAAWQAYAKKAVANGQTKVFHGVPLTGGGCTSGVILPPEHLGEQPRIAVQVSSDPGACTETYVIGSPTSAAEAEVTAEGTPTNSRPGGSWEGGSGAAGTPISSVAHARAAATSRHPDVMSRAHRPNNRRPVARAASSFAAAYFLTTIAFNSNEVEQRQVWVKTTIEWHYNGSCVVSPTPTVGYEEEWWEPWGHGTTDFPSEWECSRVWAARGSDLGNRYNSCGSGNAWIHIMRNTIDGYASGGFEIFPGDSWCDNNISLYHVYRYGYY